MRGRGLLLLVTGFLLAGGSVLVAHSYLKNAATHSGEAQAREISTIVVARSEIPFGAPIRFEMLRLQEWPKEALPPEAFLSLEEVLGAEPAGAAAGAALDRRRRADRPQQGLAVRREGDDRRRRSIRASARWRSGSTT